MKIAAINVTWNQPVLLGRMIECFLRQTHDDRRLLILDDAGQYPELGGDRWLIVSTATRYPSLGEKRNAAVAMAIERWPDIDAIAVADTDDIYLPHHLEACVAALQDHQWCQPIQVLVQGGGRFKRMLTYRENNYHFRGYHGGWAFRQEAFEKLDGYAKMDTGEDAEIGRQALRSFGLSADTISPEFPDPTYCYTTTGQHLSAMGSGGYEKLGRQKIEPVDKLDISWPEDYSKWPIDDEVLPRNW